jgi:hypothetical protein
MKVKNSEVRQHILGHLAALVQGGELAAAMSCGLHPQELDALVSMGDLQLIELAKLETLGVEIRIDRSAFQEALSLCKRRDKDEQALAYYLHHGASVPMFHRHFKIAKRDVMRLRRKHWLTSRQGRPPMPPADVREQIVKAYHALPAAMAERDRFIALHQQFCPISRTPCGPLNLASIWNTVAGSL